MSATHTHDVSSHIKLYLIIGAALLVGTVLTVWASYITSLGITLGIILAVIIATVKGSLVAVYFMHLKEERQFIYGVLLLTAAFIVVMVGLFLFAFGDQQSLKNEHGYRYGAFVVPDGHVPDHSHGGHESGEHKVDGHKMELDHVP